MQDFPFRSTVAVPAALACVMALMRDESCDGQKQFGRTGRFNVSRLSDTAPLLKQL
jgi:hypothetical protein